MFRSTRLLLEELTALRSSVGALTATLQAGLSDLAGGEALGPRLEHLEARLETYAAKAEGVLVKADSHMKAARAAEERARVKERRAVEASSSAEAEESFTPDELEALEQYMAASQRAGSLSGGGGAPLGEEEAVYDFRRRRRGA